AAFHRQWPGQRGAQPLSADDERSQFTAHLNKVIDDRIAASPDGGIDAALLELDRRQILKWASHHFDHHQKYDRGCGKLGAAMAPTHLEFRFGSSRHDDADADPDSTNNAFVLDIAGEPIRVTGQIDRVDVGTLDGQTVFNVIDYKSGRRASLKSDQIETGQQLQLPIYVEAAQLLLFNGEATPLAAGYWSMGNGFDEKGALAARKEGEPGPQWGATQAMVHGLIREFVDGIRKGDFPVASRDDKCTSYCDFNLVCRISQARNSGKTWWPDQAACGLAQNTPPSTGDPLGRG
ncbi:MAG: PD-(D/E)XK nuclease family protein, partial [Pirellulales bacterium]